MHYVQQLILDQNLHCLAISEEWLDAEVSDGEITIAGYTLLRRDRASGSVGGICVFTHDSIAVKQLQDFQHPDIK